MPSPPVDAQVPSFADIGLNDALVSQLETLGLCVPTPIQARAIGPLLQGNDVLGQAATGTGKTAAFGLPMLQHIKSLKGQQQGPAGLVLTPTRELAIQVAKALTSFSRPLGTRVLAVYGGQPIVTQLRALSRGVDVVVATPGRALDLMARRALSLAQVSFLVLDEADEMLDMGFAEDLDALFAALPKARQTALFSATLPPRIANLAARHMHEPTHIKIAATAAKAGSVPQVDQRVYFVPPAYKAKALARIVDYETPTSCIVFCRTRQDVDNLTQLIVGRGYKGESLHGGLSQEQRDRVMHRFRDGATTLLIATDVAARGLDIDHVSHVFNYDVPRNAETYVHRIGRTGRAGRSGVAITFAQPRDRRLLRSIEAAGRAPVTVAQLPSVADLRRRRLESTCQALVAAAQEPSAAADDLLKALEKQLDMPSIARAALTLLQASSSVAFAADEEIPSAAAKPPMTRRPAQAARPGSGPRSASRQPQRRDARAGWTVASLYVSAGRDAGVRPGDLVGAIANELDLDARAIGAIEIASKFSLVEVPEEIADDIVAGLRGATIKGQRVTVRRDRGIAPREA